MSMYDYIQKVKDKYEDLHSMSFYECPNLCRFCRHSAKGEPADKCTNAFCWKEVDRIMRTGKTKKNEQLSLF